MKKQFYTSLLFGILSFVCCVSMAQAPLSFNYQAVVRGSNGSPVSNTPVSVRFTIHDGSVGGTAVFTETQNVTANQFGLINAQIGSVNSLSAVNWNSGTKFLQVESDVNTTGTFADMGTTQLISVPYALSAASAVNNWSLTGNSGTVDTLNFIGNIDFAPLNFRLGNSPSGRIEPPGFGYNTALGYHSLNLNYGYSNSAFGYNALSINTSGQNNTGIGLSALSTNSTGSANTAVGAYSLNANTTSNDNTAVGSSALANNSNGAENTAVGSDALHDNTGGDYNTAVGKSALRGCYGNGNTALGDEAGLNTTYGSENTAIGEVALYNNVTGNYNTALGYGAGTTGDRDHTISIGNDTYLNAASNQAFIGGTGIVWNGGNVTWSTYSDARVKRNIQDDVKGLDFITRLRPVTYYRDYKAMLQITGNKDCKDYEGKYDIEKIKFSGFLAQDVEKAANEAGYNFSGITVPKAGNELYTLSYEQFVVPLVKGMQEQQKMIEKQNAVIEALQKEVENLKKK